MTSRADDAEHAVMATELEQANRTGQPPMGLCGTVVDLAPLGATARHVCRPCREAVARRQGPRPTSAPWTLLVQWYEALVRLLRGGLVHPAPAALPTAARLALPAAPVSSGPLPPPVPVDRPVPSPRPRPSAPVRAPHPAREMGGRHRRD